MPSNKISRDAAISSISDSVGLAFRHPSNYRPALKRPKINPRVRDIILDLYFPASRMGLSDLVDQILEEKAAGAVHEKPALLSRFQTCIADVRKPVTDLIVEVTGSLHAHSQMFVGQKVSVAAFLRDQVITSLSQLSEEVFNALISKQSDLKVREEVMIILEAFQLKEHERIDNFTKDMRLIDDHRHVEFPNIDA